jgi:predicted translin family RNA/ssDNA-binding protein
MPNPPYQYHESKNGKSFDLTALGKQVNEAEIKRQKAFDISRQISMDIVKVRDSMETDDPMTAEKLKQVETSLIEAVGSDSSTRVPREANLGSLIEDTVRLMAFDHFLKTSGLVPPSSCPFATDEEYLAGACMGLCQTLARYGMGRAITRDLSSVVAARDLVRDILDYLLKIDFRNGYLRRRYDGCKYALKSLETILYELSVTSQAGDNEPSTKRKKLEEKLSPEVSNELKDIQKRMEHRDEMREKLIKRCRDGQQAAKQATFALHREDHGRAYLLIAECEDCIREDLLPIVEEEPPLRTGSFEAVMEEYIEAKLFYTWLNGKEETPNDESSKSLILNMEDFEIQLEPVEYLGGLCEMTGEIGRCALKCGTERDIEGAKHCLEASASISIAIELMASYPSSIGKKVGFVKRGVEKLEKMTYEMSLVLAAGGLKVSTADLGPPGPASAAALSAAALSAENAIMIDASEPYEL